MAQTLADRKLHALRVLDEGIVACPFGFDINGTTTPDAVLGDIVADRAVTYAAAGKFTFVMNNLPYQVIGGFVNMQGGDATDFTADLDYSLATTTGVITIRTKTGGTLTNPTDDTHVGGVLFCKLVARRAGA